MQLTISQRVEHLERRVREQGDKIMLLHRLVKELKAIQKEQLLNALASKEPQTENKEKREQAKRG
jgi:hypothetical protein